MLNHYILIIIGCISIGAPITSQTDKPCPQEIIEIIKKKHNATLANQRLTEIAHHAFRACNTELPMAVLESPTEQDCIISRFHSLKKDAQNDKFLILNTKNPRAFNELEWTIYHEIGHSHYNHGAKKEYYMGKLAIATAGTTLASLAASIYGAAKAGLAKTRIGLVGTAAAGLAGYISYCMCKSAFLRKSRSHEQEADIFAYKNLIQQKKITCVLEGIADFLCMHGASAHTTITTHPTDLDRAKYGLYELQKAGYSIHELLNNLPADLDPGIKNRLSDAVKKYCPEFLP